MYVQKQVTLIHNLYCFLTGPADIPDVWLIMRFPYFILLLWCAVMVPNRSGSDKADMNHYLPVSNTLLTLGTRLLRHRDLQDSDDWWL